MTEASYEIDVASSRIRVHTQATGLLARLAHDLELEASGFEPELTADGDAWSAELRFSPARLRVVGVRRGERVDETVLSAKDKDDIRQLMDERVFSGVSAVVVRAEGAQRGRGSATVQLHKQQTVSVRHAVSQRDDESWLVEGRCSLSLRALGAKEVKGPLGAFKVHDGIDVLYSVVVRAASSASS